MQTEQKTSILLVDDHPANLVALEAIFTGLDYNLVKAPSGETALDCLLKEDFAVILLDVQMPGMDGFETATLIRMRERSRHTPIIFLTAINKTDEHMFKGYSIGAVDYLFKPIVPEILRAKVSVFVDLSNKTRELEKARQREQKELELRRLDEHLAQSNLTTVSSQAYGIFLLSRSSPEKFREFVKQYGELLDLALEQRVFKVEHHISEKLRAIAEEMGFFKAGPRDVAEIHFTTLKRKLNELYTSKADAYIREGHLLAFELMGYLTTYYRNFYLATRKSKTPD
jgi:response regulator RpfG family c-di-GMP phosphodiesterase